VKPKMPRAWLYVTCFWMLGEKATRSSK
jgi:hypothetical protein